MELSGAAAGEYVKWEEVHVAGGEKGRREVKYYLKRKDGSLDLAVFGKEKSGSRRHMSYHNYLIRDDDVKIKLRSRRDVVNWLNTFLSDSSHLESTFIVGGSSDSSDVCELDTETYKDTQSQKMSNYSGEFLWLGAPWTCRKRRRHYQSFCRNGVDISVHDFVYVLAEENKRLVAFLEDLYEDCRGNKMVVVRWFHKIDEVGIVLPHNFNDREIFFSLCLQDLSIECIDGLATVLSPQHFEKFLTAASHTRLQPFVCQSQFDSDEVKPFDVTQLKGYWKQEILRFMCSASPLKVHLKSRSSGGGVSIEENDNDVTGLRPKKRHRPSKEANMSLNHTDKRESMDIPRWEVQKLTSGLKGGSKLCVVNEGSPALLSGVNEAIQKPSQLLAIGSQVEVLSQDSGMRGCWFRASIIKKSKDKLKVQYQDILDAADETNKLEEWVLASRIAVPDQLGIRMCGRMTVRPVPYSNKGRVSWAVDVGAAVDVWCNDGWWEGIVIRKESEEAFHVYFPGEKKLLMFNRGDLRHSQEWLGSEWKHIKERPDIVSLILSSVGTEQIVGEHVDHKPMQEASSASRQLEKDEVCNIARLEAQNYHGKDLEAVTDLSKDDSLAQLKWKSSRKRRRGTGSPPRKLIDYTQRCPGAVGLSTRERFFISSSLKVDHENCKYSGDSVFSSSVVPPLTSLVMSR